MISVLCANCGKALVRKKYQVAQSKSKKISGTERVKYSGGLKNSQTQAKRANKAKGEDVSYTPDTLCLDIGFRQCVEAGMS